MNSRDAVTVITLNSTGKGKTEKAEKPVTKEFDREYRTLVISPTVYAVMSCECHERFGPSNRTIYKWVEKIEKFRRKFRRVFRLNCMEDATKTCGPSAPPPTRWWWMCSAGWKRFAKMFGAHEKDASTSSERPPCRASSSSLSCDRRNTKENCRFRFPFELNEK